MSTLSVKWQHCGLFRRFSVTTPAYEEVVKKMKSLVPEFDGKFAWKDSDGDLIAVGTTVELQEAVRVMAANGGDGLLRLFSLQTEANTVPNTPRVEEKQEEAPKLEEAKKEEKKEDQPPTGPQLHPGITCDGCNKPVIGVRHKCVVCTDFDLCAECEGNKVHQQHPMLRIADPNDHSWKWMLFRGPRGGHPHCPMPPGMMGGPRGGRGMGGRGRHCGRGPGQPPRWFTHMFPQPPTGTTGPAEQQQQNTTTTAEGTAPPQGPPPQWNDGLNFLKEVGEQVAAALTNLGIDVDIDVEHGGKTEKVANPSMKTEEPPKTEEEPKEDVAIARKPEEDPTPTAPPATEEGQKAKITQTDSKEEKEWTILDGSPATDANAVLYPTLTPCPGPFVPTPTPIAQVSSNEVVQAALVKLQEMGFGNDDGWLLQLVEAKRGDINAVLNALAPAGASIRQ